MTEQTRTVDIPLHIRAADDTEASSEATGYDISGIAVPFGEEYRAWDFVETFSTDCIFEGLDQAKLYWQHSEIIGKITGAQSTERGLEIDAAISHTPRGDEAATLVRDGAIDRFSIGFQGIEYTSEARDDGTELWTWNRVRIREVSLVSFPAYDQAALTEVRHRTPHTERNAMTGTETLTRADLDEIRNEYTEGHRALQAQLATIGEAHTPTEVRFRTFGDYVRAYHQGDSEARDISKAWAQATTDVALHDKRAFEGGVIADTIAKAPWVGDAIRLIDKPRKVLNSFQTAALPATGTSVEYGVLESNTVQVSKQEDEGDDLVKGKVTVGSSTAPVGTYGGWSELSFQSVERADISLLNLTRRAQLIAYAQQTEAEVRALFTSTIAGNISSGHKLDFIASPKAADWVSLMIDAHDAFDDAALPIAGLYLSKDKFKELFTLADQNDRLQFQIFGTGSNVVGELKTEGLEGQVSTTRVRLLPGAAAGTGAFYNEQAITTFESAGAPVALEDMNIVNLSRSYSVYGYLATACEIPDAILPIDFGGTSGGTSGGTETEGQ